jgi:hypothetical protein
MKADSKRRVQRALTCVLVLLVNLAAFAPRLVFKNPTPGGALDMPASRPSLPGLSYELGLVLGVLALTAGARRRRVVRVAAVVLYAAFLLFSIYHEAFMRLVYFGPTVVDDWRLLLNLMHFVHDASWAWKLSILPSVLGYLAAIALAAWTFRRFQDEVRDLPWRARAGGALAWAIAGALALILAPRNVVVQPISDGVISNLKSSRAALRSWRAIEDAPPDTRYDGYPSLRFQHRPNVYLLMVEAYGEVLATCTSNVAYRDLLSRMEARLAQAGFHARSGYSVAPIFGARSWLTMASVQTGIHIDNQPSFRVLERNIARLPTLTSFFEANGYYTMMLQPLDAPRVGVTSDDIYRRDRGIVRNDIPYRGPHTGLAGVPDQYSLGYFDAHELSTAPQPRFVFYMAVSTHYPWWNTGPFVRDWRKLDGPVGPDDLAPWTPLAGRAQITDPTLGHYLDTVEYEWRALADFIEARKAEDALIIVLGDHQPRLECPGQSITYHTPIHVLSRDAALVDRFADVGLEPGLYAEPGRHAPLKHEGLFSLIVTQLTSKGTYLPDGIGLSGLRR